MLGFLDMTPEGKKYFKELEKLSKMEVRVGWQQGQAQEENGTDMAMIAAYNEFGSSSGAKPARPFMKQSFEKNQDKLQAMCDQANNKITNGESAEQALEFIGAMCKGLVQKEIAEGEFAPNAPSTIAMKGSSRPLIDTGTMRQTVDFVVKPRG